MTAQVGLQVSSSSVLTSLFFWVVWVNSSSVLFRSASLISTLRRPMCGTATRNRFSSNSSGGEAPINRTTFTKPSKLPTFQKRRFGEGPDWTLWARGSFCRGWHQRGVGSMLWHVRRSDSSDFATLMRHTRTVCNLRRGGQVAVKIVNRAGLPYDDEKALKDEVSHTSARETKVSDFSL